MSGEIANKNDDYLEVSDEKSLLDTNEKSVDEKVEDPKPESLLNKLIESAGYRPIHYEIILFQFLVVVLGGIYMTLMSSLYIPVQNFYSLNDYQMVVISSPIFLAIGIGSFISGNEILVPNRPFAIKLYTFIIFACSLTIALFPNMWVFIFVRLILCVALGIIMPVMANILCEVLPVKNRSLYLVLCSMGFTVGVIFLNVTMLIVMPGMEKEKLNTVLLIISVPSLIIFIIFMVRIKDSPRNLILNDRTEEGFAIFENIIQRQLNEHERQVIKRDITGGVNKSVEKKLSSIFNDKFLLITTLMIFIWIINSFVAYGSSIILSLTIEQIDINNMENNTNNTYTPGDVLKENNKVIKDTIFIYLLSSPGYILSAFLTEIKLFGRKMTTFFGFFFIGIFCFLATMFQSKFRFLYGCASFFMSVSFSGANSYTSEVYPTKIRDVATGFLYFCSRSSGFISQFIAVMLYKIHYMAHFYTVVVLCFVACFLTYMLPYDTHGMSLDTNEEKKKEAELHNSKSE